MKHALLTAVMAGCLGLSSSALAVTVYDNFSTSLGIRLESGTTEIADEIMLGGTERNLLKFESRYYLDGQSSGTETLRIRFYQQDGAGGAPGTLFYDSGAFAATLPGFGAIDYLLEITDFVTSAAMALTQALPNRFTWSLQFDGLANGETAGIPLYSPPTVGNSVIDYWENTSTGWVNKRVGGDDPVNSDFPAWLEAGTPPGVPEPSNAVDVCFMLVLLAFGAHRYPRSRRQESPA